MTTYTQPEPDDHASYQEFEDFSNRSESVASEIPYRSRAGLKKRAPSLASNVSAVSEAASEYIREGRQTNRSNPSSFLQNSEGHLHNFTLERSTTKLSAKAIWARDPRVISSRESRTSLKRKQVKWPESEAEKSPNCSDSDLVPASKRNCSALLGGLQAGSPSIDLQFQVFARDEIEPPRRDRETLELLLRELENYLLEDSQGRVELVEKFSTESRGFPKKSNQQLAAFESCKDGSPLKAFAVSCEIICSFCTNAGKQRYLNIVIDQQNRAFIVMRDSSIGYSTEDTKHKKWVMGEGFEEEASVRKLKGIRPSIMNKEICVMDTPRRQASPRSSTVSRVLLRGASGFPTSEPEVHFRFIDLSGDTIPAKYVDVEYRKCNTPGGFEIELAKAGLYTYHEARNSKYILYVAIDGSPNSPFPMNGRDTAEFKRMMDSIAEMKNGRVYEKITVCVERWSQ